jgi:hypothetical protein
MINLGGSYKKHNASQNFLLKDRHSLEENIKYPNDNNDILLYKLIDLFT